MFDLVIRDATICDGSGEPAFRGSVAVKGDRIVAVGDIAGPTRKTVEANGLMLAPGFIDQHTHYDAQLVWDGLAQPSLEHGVTTIMPGNCSLSLAPLKVEHRDYLGETFRKIEEMPKAALDAGLVWSWETFEEYIAAIRGGLGINVAPVVGHSLIRMCVMGDAARHRAARAAETEGRETALRECLAAGAVALSTSWVDIDPHNRPVPCRLADPEELDALCGVLAEYGAILQVVPEFWDADLLGARIDILANLSRRHGIAATFSPLFHSNGSPEITARALDRVRLQAANGARVHPQMQVRSIDMAFELNTPSTVTAGMPGWWKLIAEGQHALKAALLDPERREALTAEARTIALHGGMEANFEEAIVRRVNLSEHKALLGRRLKDIARERGTTSIDAMIDIALLEDLDVSFAFEGMGHNAVEVIGELLNDRHISIGAGDGGAHIARFATYGDTGLLFSRYVRRDKGLAIEEAVRKLTSDIAGIWNLKDRGMIREGFAADLVLFDPVRIDRGPEYPEYDLPGGAGFRYMRRAEGVAKVWVNGRLAYDGVGGYTDARGGVIVEIQDRKTPAAPATAPSSQRRWTSPRPGDDWPRLAARALPDVPVNDAIARLQSWNLYLAYRVAPAEITPSDILFIEPPLATA